MGNRESEMTPISSLFAITHYPLPITHYPLPITHDKKHEIFNETTFIIFNIYPWSHNAGLFIFVLCR